MMQLSMLNSTLAVDNADFLTRQTWRRFSTKKNGQAKLQERQCITVYGYGIRQTHTDNETVFSWMNMQVSLISQNL